MPKGMADWSKWDGKYQQVNNKNRPAGVGTVSQARRKKMKAKALAREAAEAEAAAAAAATPCQKESATPCQKESEKATPCQKECGPSQAEMAKEQEQASSSNSSSTSNTSSSSSTSSLQVEALAKKAKIEEQDGTLDERAASSSNKSKKDEKKAALDKRDEERPESSKEQTLDKRMNKAWHETAHGIYKSRPLDKRGQSEETVLEPEPQWILKEGPHMRVCIHYHQCLEVNNSIPGANVRAVQALVQKGYQVFLRSFAFAKREKEVRNNLAKVDIPWTALKFTRARCGPEGKAAWLEKNNIGHLFDDNREILEEAESKGIEVWPIVTKWQEHWWTHRRFGTLWKAIEFFLQHDGQKF